MESAVQCSVSSLCAFVLSVYSGEIRLNRNTKAHHHNHVAFCVACLPCLFAAAQVGEIIKRFEAKGFKLTAMKMKTASEDHLKKHYADLSSKGFFAGLVKCVLAL